MAQGNQVAEETTRGGGLTPQQEEGDKGHDPRQSSGGQHNKKRGTKDMIKDDRMMAVVGGGDAAGKKCNNQIEARTAVVVRTVGAAMDGGEARAKGEMSVRMLTAGLQGIQPCKCKRKGHQWIG
jgi:hypothetical protein